MPLTPFVPQPRGKHAHRSETYETTDLQGSIACWSATKPVLEIERQVVCFRLVFTMDDATEPRRGEHW